MQDIERGHEREKERERERESERERERGRDRVREVDVCVCVFVFWLTGILALGPLPRPTTKGSEDPCKTLPTIPRTSLHHEAPILNPVPLEHVRVWAKINPVR